MKKVCSKNVLSLLMVLCLFMTAFCGVAFAEDVASPVFSIEGGIYASSFSLTIDGGGNSVYYTLDGSEPTERSTLYSGAIEIAPKAASPRSVQGRVAQQRIEPGVVIRAVCIDDFGNASEVVTNTYFVSDEISDIFSNVPIIALTTAPENLWDEKEGIYTNYDYEHNVPAYIEFFDNDGDGFERGIEVKVGGHGSRSNPKKSLRIYFTKGDANGSKNLEYNFIEGTDKNFYDDSSVKKYGKVTLRISDWAESDLKDVVAQKIGEFMRPETANSTPAAVFLNGEFWGIYENREQYDNRYVDYHYEGVDKDDVVYFDRDWTLENTETILADTGDALIERVSYEEGPGEDEELYRDILNYTKYLMIHSSEADNFAELAAYVDIDNFIDYLFVYLYCDNIDWPGNNYKFWRTTIERSNGDTYGADGRWRFMLHDFDLAFDTANNNTLEYAIKSTMENTNARQPEFAAKELDGLFQTEAFRNEFAQRAAAYMSTAVTEESMSDIVQNLISERGSVKMYDLLRWNNMSGTSFDRLNAWKEYTTNKFIGFISERNESFYPMIRDFLKKYYGSGISGEASFTFETDAENASVSVSGAVIRKSLYGDKANSFTTKQYAGIPIEISAETKEGYVISSITIESPSGETIVYDGSVVITPEEGDYKVTIAVAPGEKSESKADDFIIARVGRFEKMQVREKLPIDIVSPEGEKIFGFECEIDSDCARLGDNNIVYAESRGTAKGIVTYNGIRKEFDIVIE